MSAPGSFAWLVRHELRLAWRGRPRRGATAAIGLVLLAVWVLAGIAIALALRTVPLPPSGLAYAVVAAGSVAAMTLMTTQAMLGSQQTLYGTNDLELLLTAPVPPRRVLLAKQTGIAANVALTYALLLLPAVLPVAAIGHPRLFGVAAVLLACALLAASIGSALTLTIARLAGPRAARTVGQIAAALMGGAFFLVTQLGQGQRRSPFVVVFRWLQARGLGANGWTSWPGRAAFGEPVPLLLILAIGVAAFAGTGWAMQRLFLSGYQDAGMRLTRARPTGRASGRLFHASLFRATFAKEWRLLARDPTLAFQIALRLIYMAPLALVVIRSDAALPLAPALAFASVLIAGQLAGSFAWLAVAAEDAPELLMAAPIAKARVNRAKLGAALAMAAPLALVLPVVIARSSPAGALVALTMTALGGLGAAAIEVALAKPAPRAAFARRRRSGFVAGLLSLLVTALCGGGAAVGAWLVG
ncbi:hypothetical protein [Sphingomonas sp.]|uniref:hypothetical protein n=1 Tax=Sphingomonas sp. TaxID=28214 RepID=UPI003CC5A468